MTSNYTLSKRLNRDEFAVALRKGQGRALLHVIHYGLADIDDLVLEACIHNQVYDQQLESGRGDWLFSMFRETPYYSTFRAEILNGLNGETESWNLFQLIQLARNMAASGDAVARTVMEEAVYRIAANPDSDDWIGVEDWLDLEGAEGMLQLARVYGRRLLDNPEDFVNDRLLEYEGHPDFRDILKQKASTDKE